MKRDRILTIKLPSPGALEEFAIHEPRQFHRPKKPFTRKALAAAHVVADPFSAKRPLARCRHRLGCDAGLPPPSLVVGLRRGRGHGHGATRHGARLEQFAGAGAPLDPGRRQRRCGRERRRHRPPSRGEDVLDSGNHRRLRGAMRGDREARRPHHPDGEPRARRLGQVTRRLRTRIRPHPRAGEGAGDHPLAGRDVRSGAGRVLGEEGSLRRHGGLPFGSPEERSKVDGIKISLLDKDKEIVMRRKLPKGVRMYTGDDFNFAELIEGDAQGYSDALLGIFDSIAPAASQALSFLSEQPDCGIPRGAGAHGPLVAPHLQGADALL